MLVQKTNQELLHRKSKIKILNKSNNFTVKTDIVIVQNTVNYWKQVNTVKFYDRSLSSVLRLDLNQNR